MAANEELPDPSASPAPKISPYLMMQAQAERDAGKPGPAIMQLGAMALKSGAMHPSEAAMHGEMAGVLPPGTTQKMRQAAPDVSNVRSIADAAPIMNASPLMGVNSISDAAQMQGGASPQQDPAPQAGVAGNAQGPSQAQVGGTPPIDPAALQSMIDQHKTMQDAGMKNDRFSLDNEQKNTQGTTSKIDVGATPGTYSRGSGEAQGYTYTANPDGTYNKSDKPDPNSPFQKQQSALDQLQALVAARAARGQPVRPTDLTGLMMMADFTNGGDKFTKAYRGQLGSQIEAQNDAEKQDQQQFSDQAQALKEQSDLYKQAQQGALGIMGGGSVGSVNNLVATQKALEAAGQAKGVNPDQGKMTDQQFNQFASGLAGQGQKKDSSLNDLARMLALGNPTADNMSVVAGAKAMAGTSRINTAELSMLKNPDSSLWGRVDQIMGRVGNGQYTPEDRAQLMQLYQQLTQARSVEAQANMGMISHANTALRMHPEDDQVVHQTYGTAMQPNVANTNFNLQKAGPPHKAVPVTQNQNYDGSTPIPANASPAMKQARIKFLQSKGGQQ